jgi:hypothetical protein
MCLGEKRLAAGDEVSEAIGDPLVRARRAAIGRASAGPHRSEAGDFGRLVDRLEQGPAAGTQIADQIVRPRCSVQADLAGEAFEDRPPSSVTSKYT